MKNLDEIDRIIEEDDIQQVSTTEGDAFVQVENHNSKPVRRQWNLSNQNDSEQSAGQSAGININHNLLSTIGSDPILALLNSSKKERTYPVEE